MRPNECSRTHAHRRISGQQLAKTPASESCSRILDVYEISCHLVPTSELGNVLPPEEDTARKRGVKEGKLTPRHDVQATINSLT